MKRDYEAFDLDLPISGATVTEHNDPEVRGRDSVWKPVPPLVQLSGGVTTQHWMYVACSTYVRVPMGEPFFWHPLTGWYV